MWKLLCFCFLIEWITFNKNNLICQLFILSRFPLFFSWIFWIVPVIMCFDGIEIWFKITLKVIKWIDFNIERSQFRFSDFTLRWFQAFFLQSGKGINSFATKNSTSNMIYNNALYSNIFLSHEYIIQKKNVISENRNIHRIIKKVENFNLEMIRMNVNSH